jgi:CPA1 family monovalent cation:H+ antiporter
MPDTHFTITIFIVLLLIASGVAMITKWVRVPYTLALVIVGIITSQLHFLPTVHVSPDLILLIFLPALLFEASWNLDFRQLRANLAPILWLSVVGVVLSVVMISLALHYFAGLSWFTALIFGAIVSATDPVSVLALFRRLGAPARLALIIEGESLFNDGTAAVIFRILVGLVVASTYESIGRITIRSVIVFLTACIGGAAIGVMVGFVSSKLTSFFEDHLLEITLTTISAYGSFVLADALHVSPVLAVVMAGIVIGNYGRSKGMSNRVRESVDSFWEYAAFAVNSLLFLLIGMEIPLGAFRESFMLIAWAVAAMTLARAATVYGLFPLLNQFSPRVGLRWQTVIFWGGLRGSLSIALLLSLPLSVPGRSELLAMTFGAVAFSLLVQGLTVEPLLRALRIKHASPAQG